MFLHWHLKKRPSTARKQREIDRKGLEKRLGTLGHQAKRIRFATRLATAVERKVKTRATAVRDRTGDASLWVAAASGRPRGLPGRRT